uniref:NWD1/2-like winged helix-turn-helix domain-containing protein n=1 Tax=Fundulus heteroclitus TaxID=8078 RepID=A0A3Q2NV95_FUNHE
RRALREKVIPSFREHCRNWLFPVPSVTEAQRLWLLFSCIHMVALQALVGHQYGAAPLPTQVEASEYQLLLQQSQQAGVCTRQLERAYRRDENVVPPSYRLMSSVKSSCSPPVITPNLFILPFLNIPDYGVLFLSLALGADLRFALESGSVEDILNRCVIYFIKVILDIERRDFFNKNVLNSQAGISEQTVPAPSELLSQLCDSFLPALLTSRQILLYTTTTECDHRHGYTTARRRAYADSLCQQVFSDLMALTDSSSLTQLRGKAQIRDYVKQKYQQRPLVLTGGPCTGKTVLVARCAEQVSGQNFDSGRHIDFNSFDILHLKEISIFLNTIEVDVSLSELEERLASLLAHLPSTKHPLVLILDGLDQLDNNVVAQIISGLPSPLPDAVKLVVTVSSNRGGLLQAIKLEEETGYACIQLQSGDRKQCAKLLESLLRTSGRKVTSGQQALVNRALTSCCLPLYARLLHAHTSLWHSDSDVTESSLPDCVHSSISALLDHLEQKHGSSLVARTVSYVSLSRTGLCESELVDLLSSARGDPAEREGTVSQVDVEWLLMDLKDFLVKRPVADSRVLSWVSRHFKLVVTKKYLGTHEARRKIHSEMVDYLSGGRAVFVNHTSETENEPDGQPFVFPATEDVCWANTRKILELPHHLQQSGRLEEMERGLLMSSGFHRAMVQAGMLSDLVAMLEADEGSTKFLRERWLLASTLKSSACFLQTSPLQLPTVMETSLLPYLDVFPALEGYVRDIRRDRRKNGKGVGSLLCSSSSSVPPIRYLGPNPKSRANSVVETACTECGVVVEITDEGSAWIWRGSACDLVELSLSKEQRELRFAGVKSSGRFLLLSTRCNELLAWDVAGPERLIEVKQSLKTESAAVQTASTIEGFVSCQEKLCTWWKKESFVSVFDMSSSTVTRFQCQSSVMCLIASSNSLSVYCGQEDSTVSIFDLITSSLLGTCVNSTRSAIMQVILCEEEQGMACVDKGGSIALWDIADKQQPPRLVKENSNQGKPSSVLNTDYSEAVSTLLVCQSHQVTLWDTCNWEMWDQFLASQGKAFTQAVLSLDGHLFLALLDHFLLVLVWRVSTGECVLSLETNAQPLTLLKTASDIVCVSQDGGLTVWDSEMINAAGTATKMRRGVKAVVVEQTGKCFYTADGSENVWRWSLDVGLPRFTFLHDGPVEKMQLSPNGSHLLSLSAGEIYIWQTKTGENIARIRGGGAADVLITPNSKFGVSISKRGLSRVWKLPHGGIVCSIHQYLSEAQVSAEGTFLVGLRYGDLLAASLWSGSISKRFSCIENSERVVAFRTLWDHPDFVVVLTASEAVYTWKLSEETVCQHFQLPLTFHCQPQDFHMSPDGSYALLSTDNNSVNILDLSRVRLCSLKAEGPVIKACLDKTGGYVVYVCNPSGLERSCACDLHSKLVLTVIRLSDRERVGSVRLHKTPLVLTVSEQQGVFVGFDDGSVGVFSVAEAALNEEEFVWDRENLKGELIKCPLDREPLRSGSEAIPVDSSGTKKNKKIL